jgi:hypothetical protein
MATMVLGGACGESPSAASTVPLDNEIFRLLDARQRRWCEAITGRDCAVSLSAIHPEYAAWVDWGSRPPGVFWNQRVLTDRQFWITEPRMAHEACHLKHGLQPGWTAEEKEEYADWCARAYTGAAP